MADSTLSSANPHALADTVVGLLPRCGAERLDDIRLALPATEPEPDHEHSASTISDNDDDPEDDAFRSAAF
ncbi:hypothetical protein [Nocardia sp. CY41]|uniref:hypothetical protein n=1 Tax=Nocardia sp. CY41 TaxID=2608686 RepID=UPI001357DABB|nr:hypothetical protein [Nocardia sp. CY41]